jgi:acylphosphatase
VKAFKAVYSGHVQGIFFRATALDISARYDIYGYVKNMSDGSVDLFVEGEEADIKEFIEELRQAKIENVEKVEVSEVKLEGYPDFRIDED